MFRVILCMHCGTRQKTLFRIAPGKKVRCQACGHTLPAAAMEDLLRMQGLMRMGDDDGGGGGGGDWGGGSTEESSASEGDDDDEEEDDGKGGKKKKKKSAAPAKGGFFQQLLSGFITRVITAVVFFGLLGSCCCCFLGWGMIFGGGPPFIGEWEGSVLRVAKIDDNKDAKKDDKDDKDGKGVKDVKKDGKDVKDVKDKDKKEPEDVNPLVPVKLVIAKTDDKSGTGTYTNEDGKALPFKWRDFDKEKKTVVFEMDNKDNTFWEGVKSPATFKYEVLIGIMTLTSGDKAMTFTKVSAPAPNAPPPVKAGKKK